MMRGEKMKLHIILADTWRSIMTREMTNQAVPFTKRVVTIELTPEQEEAVKPQHVGTNGGVDMYEEILEVIVEEGEW